jgi:hypothetical protein
LNLQVAISFRQAKSSWKTENVNLLILSKFKEWMSQLSESDVDFRHRATAICFMARSRVCTMLQHPMVMELHMKLSTTLKFLFTHNLDSVITSLRYSATL